MNLSQLMEKLGYQFQDVTLLERALTHRSFSKTHNERLEFLGDAVLDFIITAELFTRYAELSEGGLSRLRSTLVNGDTLAEIAKELTLPQYLHLGPGELRSGGIYRSSILSNVMEAVIGAVYLDSDLATCKVHVLNWLNAKMEIIQKEGVKKDPKTLLQELLQAKKMHLPRYKILSISGREHTQLYSVKCEITGKTAVGTGSSRRRAEQDAAQRLMQELV
ncbi:MAG: ribonuclease III [Gammaproteobacteria bacterium]